MKKFLTGVFILLFATANFASSDNENMTMSDSKIAESYVMLYYKSLDAPRKFYANVLGLQASFEDDWVSLYRITSDSYVGLVREGGTAYHKAQHKNAVMLSLVVDKVDEWYEKIKMNKDVLVLKEIYNHAEAPIRAFLVEDPGGYTLEIFQWLKK
jgi:glyoxalase/bleomycin resistance protein/dioxygenase superfamily protein